jgi:hypothetical protein
MIHSPYDIYKPSLHYSNIIPYNGRMFHTKSDVSAARFGNESGPGVPRWAVAFLEDATRSLDTSPTSCATRLLILDVQQFSHWRDHNPGHAGPQSSWNKARFMPVETFGASMI